MWWDQMGRTGWRRQIMWVPRGPAGIALFLIAVMVILALVVTLSAVLLAVAIAAGLALGAVHIGSRLLGGTRDSVESRPSDRGRRRLGNVDRPLERYLADVEEFDHVTTQAAGIDPDANDSWWNRRRLRGLADRSSSLRESAIGVERAVSRDHAAEAARPGLWELIVATSELQRYLNDLLGYPTTRGRPSQLRELQSLHERRDEVVQRRDALVRRLQETDLRGAGG